MIDIDIWNATVSWETIRFRLTVQRYSFVILFRERPKDCEKNPLLWKRPGKIREVNGSGGFCLPCFFRDRDFDKFEMQTVKTTRKEKELTSAWTKTRILIAYYLICKCYICSSEVSGTLKIIPEGWIGISRLRLQHADYGASTPPILSANVPYVIQNIFS